MLDGHKFQALARDGACLGANWAEWRLRSKNGNQKLPQWKFTNTCKHVDTTARLCLHVCMWVEIVVSDSVTLAVRLEASLVTMLETLARREGLEAPAFVQRLLRLHLAQSGLMTADERDRVLLTESLISRAIAMAVQLDHEGRFDAHFTLTVIDALFADPTFLADYERVVGGSAFSRGLAAKASLNMNLGWQIKSAVRADPFLDEKGKARRVQIKDRKSVV